MTLLAKLKYTRSVQEALALFSFLALMALCIFTILLNFTMLNSQKEALAQAQSTFAKLQARKAEQPRTADNQQNEPEGSPFLDGESLTIAGARLQSRIIAMITGNGGFVTSSQLDLQNQKPEDTNLHLSVNFDINYVKIQSLLYQIEAGMPYLFIENLDLTAPEGGGPIKASMRVSGVWLREKP